MRQIALILAFMLLAGTRAEAKVVVRGKVVIRPAAGKVVIR